MQLFIHLFRYLFPLFQFRQRVNPISIEQLNYLESYGVVFLSTTEKRGWNIYQPTYSLGTSIIYWTSTHGTDQDACTLLINQQYVLYMDPWWHKEPRWVGLPVRLARITDFNQ